MKPRRHRVRPHWWGREWWSRRNLHFYAPFHFSTRNGRDACCPSSRETRQSDIRIRGARPQGGLHFCRDLAMFCEDICGSFAPMTMPVLRDWTTYDGEGAVATSLRYYPCATSPAPPLIARHFYISTIPHFTLSQFHNSTFSLPLAVPTGVLGISAEDCPSTDSYLAKSVENVNHV